METFPEEARHGDVNVVEAGSLNSVELTVPCSVCLGISSLNSRPSARGVGKSE